MFGWILSGIGILGGILNAMGKKEGFYVWLVSNTGWIIYFGIQRIWCQAPLWVVYNAICILGIIQWSKKKIGGK